MEASVPAILELARRVERDIRCRNLVPGDGYLNTEEVARMLGVSKAAANRAMQLLAKRRVLYRKQRKGSVVAEGIASLALPAMRCVHFLVAQNYLKAEGLLTDGVVIGMQQKLPGVEVRLNFLPMDDPIAGVEKLIGEATRSSEPEGFVLVRTSLAVQRAIQASGLPAVIYGMAYPSVLGLPWLDRDHRQSARILVDYLLKRGCRRLIYLQRDQAFPGDTVFDDGLREALAEIQMPIWGLVHRHLPADQEVIKAEITRLLGQRAEAMPGLIAASEPLALGALAAISALGGRDLPLVATAIYRADRENPPPFPYIRTTLSPQEIGVHLGRFLALQAQGAPCEPNSIALPVVLEEPPA